VRTLVLTAIAVALLSAAAIAWALKPEADSARSDSPDPPVSSRAARASVPIPPGYSVVAHSRRASVDVYARPRNDRPIRTLSNPTPTGDPLVLLVNWQRPRWTWPRWVEVRLPYRPNGSTGWVRSDGFRFLLDPFRVEIDLTGHRVSVWRGVRRVLHEEIGVGRALTPTPVGMYYIVQLIKTPDPGGLYGPYAFGLSAYSTVLTSFGGGPGQIGLHGTDRPELLGTDVSHGCIRMRNDAISKLARLLPLGTPVEIRR
jgi:lipoprotein-anchoring transpeptidase ErfK/SrfK